MKIIIDSFVLDRRFRHQGSYVYARNVLDALLRLEPEVSDFRILASPNESSDVHELDKVPGVELIELPQLRSVVSWRLGVGSFTMRRLAGDAIYCPAPINCACLRTPAIVTIHDVTALKAPSQTQVKNALERTIIWAAARFSQKVLTDSENSKRDLMEVYGIPATKVAVIYLGYDQKNFHSVERSSAWRASVLKRYAIEKPYVLHHGVVQPRKNIRRLVEACRLVLEQHRDLDLDVVLAGPIGWRSEDLIANAGCLRRPRVIFAGSVPQEHLATLIRCASLCVIPSLYEGFCLPLLECMACGTPTIASRSSCLPEISGGVLRYFDPLSIEEMATTIHDGLCDSELRCRLGERGLQRAAQFSWEKCARETLAAITATASHPAYEPGAIMVNSPSA